MLILSFYKLADLLIHTLARQLERSALEHKHSVPWQAGYPKGSLPDLNLYLSGAEAQEFCANSLSLTDLTPVETELTEDGGTYYQFQIPFESFDCAAGSAGSLASINSVGFGSNSEADYASFCIDNLVLA